MQAAVSSVCGYKTQQDGVPENIVVSSYPDSLEFSPSLL
jgi:hypothetical protein